MELGLYLEDGPPSGRTPERHVADLVEQTRAASESDFALVTTGHHYLTERPHLQPVPLLSRLVPEAGSMAVGVTVLLLPLAHPIEVAAQFATLATVADEVVLGVGVGSREVEYEQFGIDPSERGRRLAESVELIRRLWTEETVTFEGEVFSVEDLTLEPRPSPTPAIWMGATTPRTIRRAARQGDVWIAGSRDERGDIADQKANHYDPVRREAGESTSVSIIRECVVAPTTAEAWALAEEYLRPDHRNYQAANPRIDDDVTGAFRSFAEDRFLVGTAEEVAEEVRRYDDELDVSHLVLRVQPPGMPQSAALRSIRALGEEVRSALE